MRHRNLRHDCRPNVAKRQPPALLPIEVVCAVGEIKSILSLPELKTSLRRLSQIKSMRDALWQPDYTYSARRNVSSQFRPESDELDQMLTFVICESFDFDILAKFEDVLSAYKQEIPHYPANLRHNFILSLADGLVTYVQSEGILPVSDKINCCRGGRSKRRSDKRIDQRSDAEKSLGNPSRWIVRAYTRVFYHAALRTVQALRFHPRYGDVHQIRGRRSLQRP